jgi:glutathione S-transferase
MKLYYKAGACSLAPHIVASEAGLTVALEKVDTKAGRTETGADFNTINPKGYVPALQLDSGEVLTESSVICQYLADRVPEKKLLAPVGSMERYRQLEWFNYIASELHKGIGILFKQDLPAEAKQVFRNAVGPKLDFLTKQLEGKEYLAGNFSAPDAYAFTVLSWSRHLKYDLSNWPAIGGYLRRVGDRPAVKAAMHAEGLLK